ncbi:glycosyltransferase family 4 protein [Isoptericola sp. NPDC060282]|uniref:glycosyltransferase family 4 protein n=1 Tax=unclassified Isoptericola TaxID=2623355 RepID=UPI00366473A1
MSTAGTASIPRAGRRSAAPAGTLRIVVGLAGLALGGCQINAVDLARTLRARGHDVQVVAFRDDDVAVSVLPYARAHDVDVEVLEPGRGLRGDARALARAAARHRADVVHVFAPWLGRVLAVSSVGWGARAGVETNWYMENHFWGSPRVPLVVGTGEMRQEAARRLAAPVHLMEPPVDLDTDRPDPARGAAFRAEHGVTDDQTLVVMVTRLDQEMKAEGVRQAVAAVAALDDPGVRLVVVGDGDAYDDVAAEAARVDERLGRRAVTLPGALVDPHPAYAAADVVLGMGGSAIRALAHGTALVVVGEQGYARTYEPSSVAEFERQGFYGTGGAADPVRALAALVDELHRDPGRRAALGELGLRTARERYGLQAAATTLEQVYREALATRPSGALRLADAATVLGRAALGRAARRWRGSGR